MPIRSLDELSNKLAADLAWRKKELAAIRALIELNEFVDAKNAKQNALLRSGVTILYAHWEGFVKSASSNYLEFVAMQKLPYEKLTCNFIALAMKAKLSAASETNKATVFTEATEFLLNGLKDRSAIPYKNVISTGSNLKFEIFREILCVLGLDYSIYETKRMLIDEKLLATRNSIAHGEYLQLDREEYIDLHNTIVGDTKDKRKGEDSRGLMNKFYDQILECAANRKYCRN